MDATNQENPMSIQVMFHDLKKVSSISKSKNKDL